MIRDHNAPWPAGIGPPRTPSAIQMAFGWVLSRSINVEHPSSEQITACSTVLQGDDLMRKFWEVEKTVQQHFDTAHTKDKNGTFIVPLPRKENVEP